MASDSELIQEFVRHKSDAAFAEIVARYSSLVFAAARRQVADANLAEDVTQAAFMVLARRAASVSPDRLAGWLLVTTRLCALDANKKQTRRSHYEREAAMQKSEVSQAEEPIDPQVPKFLDEALTHLRSRDCTAVAMRYLQDRPVSEVAAAIGVSPNAAQKILARTLAKLRKILARRGIVIPSTAVLAAALLHESAQTAPAALAAACSAPAANLSPHALAVSKAIGHGMTIAKIKLAAAAAAMILAIPTTAVVVHKIYTTESAAAPQVQPAPAIDSAPDAPPVIAPVPATLPADAMAASSRHVVDLPNDAFTNYPENADQFQMGVDPETRRLADSPPAGFIQATVENPATGIRYFAFPMIHIEGKTNRFRFSCWVKSQDAHQGGIQIKVSDPDGATLAKDNMHDRYVHGTTDWKQVCSVVDVPADANMILVKFFLTGSGEVWMDDMQVDTVGNDVPTTDDSNWQLWSKIPDVFAGATDAGTLHDGHPTFRMGSEIADHSQKAYYDRTDRSIAEYVGHRVRASAWIKSEEVHKASMEINVQNASDDDLTDEGNTAPEIRGTRDWQLYTAYADVPKNAKSIEWGFAQHGTGSVWIDMQSAKLEIADGPAQ
jgi:RNA polymerase sigma factor (sigma-70 family)